jgi:hypothetical protein
MVYQQQQGTSITQLRSGIIGNCPCLLLLYLQDVSIAEAVELVVGVCPPHAADEHHLLHPSSLGSINLYLLTQPVNLRQHRGGGRYQQHHTNTSTKVGMLLALLRIKQHTVHPFDGGIAVTS